ncbi:MAG: PAS domain-containing sensor histidine kinase [Chloroflexota bacterium]
MVEIIEQGSLSDEAGRTRLVHELLRLGVSSASRHEYLEAVVRLLQAWAGCRCVGARVLARNGEVPYDAYVGFSQSFWESENSISIHRDACICTRVIAGRTEPQDASCLSAGGSFWCNDTAAFVGSLTPLQQGRFRGVCVKVGFSSVAVVPLRRLDTILGALHLADEAHDKLHPEAIDFLEHAAGIIGEAIYRFDVEEALRRSEERYRVLHQSIAAGVVLYDAEGRVVDANEQAQQVLGVPLARLQELDAAEACRFMRAEDGHALRLQDYPPLVVLRDGLPVRAATLSVNRPQRPARWLLVNASPLSGEDGQVNGAVATFLDITERRAEAHERERLVKQIAENEATLRAEQRSAAAQARLLAENAEQRRLLAAVFEAAPVGLAVLAGAGPTFDFVNPAYRALTPNPAQDPVGQTYAQIWGGSTCMGVTAAVRRVLATGETEDSERQFCTQPDGSTRHFSFHCRQVNWKGTNGALVVLWDITELHQLQEGREDFVRAISHDLRQPLTVVSGQAQLLPHYLPAELGERDARLLRGLESIRVNAKRMATMIADLLESLRLESGQLQLHLAPTDLKRLIGEIVARMLGPEASRRVVVEIAEPEVVVQADPERLERVLVNLISNALAYSAPEAPVTISLRQTAQCVVVAVRDEGIGIPAKDVAHLFQRYYRTAIGRRPEGLGLGLYIARLIVESHGGRIWCESQEGQGSTFSFTLPSQ